MIINDIILENRALEPLELTVIGDLKTKRPMAGAMFSEVGSYLSQDQFKCLLRWIMTKNNSTIVRRTESSPTDNIQKTIPKTKDNAQKASTVVPPATTATSKQDLDLSKSKQSVQAKPKQQVQAKPAPKTVSPKLGTHFRNFWPKLGWKTAQEFIAAHKGKVNKTANGVWVVHPQHQYKVYTESTIIDSEQLVFEMDLYLENNNEIILEGFGTEIAKQITAAGIGVGRRFGKSGFKIVKNGITEVVKGSDEALKSLKNQSKNADDVIQNAVKTADENGEVLVKDALKNAKPGSIERETIENQTKELSKLLEKRLLAEGKLVKLADDAAKKLADDAAKTIRDNSGLTIGQWVKAGAEKIAKLGFHAILKPLALLVPEMSLVAQKQVAYGKELEKKFKHFQSINIPGGEHLSKCDQDAHKIRAILRNHGWLMSATPTGY